MSELIPSTPYAYVQPWKGLKRGTLEPESKFHVKRGKDGGVVLVTASQVEADQLCGVVNTAYEEGYLTARANTTTRKKTTAEKFFPNGVRC